MNYIEEVNGNNNILDEYFRLFDKYSNKYGKNNTILLMQVGSFHEAYQTLDKGPILQKISDMLNIMVSRKNKSITDISMKNPWMMGFPSPSLQKFLKILIDNGYTVVIGDQVTAPPNPKRAITNIISPGTYLDDNTPDVNNIISIYIEEVNNMYLIGLSTLDLTTGKSIVHEIYSQTDDKKICLDETIRFMYSNLAKEIVITTNNIDSNKINEIVSYLEISDKTYHYQTITQMMNAGKKSIFKLSYQQEVLKKIYKNTGLLSPIEYLDLEQLTYGRLSFIILLNYAYDHSHNIINNIDKPELFNESKYLNLGNNAMFQLNLLTFDRDNLTNMYNEKTQYKSLFDVLNKTSTPMGRRLLKHNLSQPLVSVSEIESRYTFIDQLMKNNKWEEVKQKLVGINDIERYSRKISLNIINPIDFYNWIQSISNSMELYNYLLSNKLNICDSRDILLNMNKMLSFISKHFEVDELSKYLINDISGRIFKNGYHKDIDTLNKKIDKCSKYMDAISWGLSTYLDNYLKTNSDNKLIKIESNDREGYFLILTKRRAEVLENSLKTNKIIKFEYETNEYVLKYEDLEFRHLPKGNNSKIFITEFVRNSSRMIEYIDELKSLQKKYYVEFLSNLWTKYEKLINIINKSIALIDYLKAGAEIAIKYHYCIPTITNKYNEKSYFKAFELRHPIIELINTDLEYIPTDIELGTSIGYQSSNDNKSQDGILLFGLNSAGKSSLQKSIGIAIIMAQMGYPVASKNFTYYPYNSLFTRISANDNIFKGLSSFALEISELRSIIKRSNKNTLVIADEVCKGTEHKSSLIIVMTMLEILSKKETSFITATHLHDITAIDRLSNLKNIKLYHLHVEYNEEKNTILYDRVLKSGSGDNFYGLNVAKFLISDDRFMNLANEIKKEIFELPDLLSNKTSNYNSNLYMDKCQLCGHIPKKSEIPLETHHIAFQKDFNNGINNKKFHLQKNHKSNLVVLCHKCHDEIDRDNIVIKGWTNSNNNNELSM